MKLQNLLEKQVIFVAFILFSITTYSQNVPIIKYLDLDTIDEVQIDYDQDGDLDYVIAGFAPDRNQGRIYLVENQDGKLNKPEYIYSFPTIGMKQNIAIHQKDNITTINVIGTSPEGKQSKFEVTLFKGAFQGMLIPPITSNYE